MYTAYNFILICHHLSVQWHTKTSYLFWTGRVLLDLTATNHSPSFHLTFLPQPLVTTIPFYIPHIVRLCNICFSVPVYFTNVLGQMVEYLPSKHEALCSSPSATKKKKNKKRRKKKVIDQDLIPLNLYALFLFVCRDHS
jgi:hypothetical protein